MIRASSRQISSLAALVWFTRAPIQAIVDTLTAASIVVTSCLVLSASLHWCEPLREAVVALLCPASARVSQKTF